MVKRWLAVGGPATVIVFITACVHAYRGAPIDAVAFFLVGAALVTDGLRNRRRRPAGIATAARRRASIADKVPGWPTAGAIAVAAAIAGGAIPRHCVADAVLILVIGVPLFAACWPNRTCPYAPVTGAPTVRAGWAWTGLGLALALWELSAFVLEDSPASTYIHPTISELFEPALVLPPTRALFAGCWAIFGFALLKWRRTP